MKFGNINFYFGGWFPSNPWAFWIGIILLLYGVSVVPTPANYPLNQMQFPFYIFSIIMFGISLIKIRKENDKK